MDEVLELATKLSNALARSQRFLTLREAEKAVMDDKETVEKVQARDELIAKLAEKERKVEPIEPEEKRELAGLDEFVKTHPGLATLSRAQADFQEMLNLVNQRITAALGTPGGEPEEE
jgi:cell fate (sporulation/competence/biofilm development) regulator YlbF (YheA/YmcA/DUF963 family)